MEKDNELGRLKAEYVAAARRVIDAIRQHGVESEIFLRASADFEALVERIKARQTVCNPWARRVVIFGTTEIPSLLA